MSRLPTPGGDNNTWGDVLNEFLSVSHNSDGTLKNLFINVKDYGAKGDGTTDDTTALSDALAALVAAGGGTLYIPPGTYIGSLTLIGLSNINIEGAGWSSVIKLPDGSNTNAIRVSGCTNIRISNLALDGNRDNVSTSGVIYAICLGIYIVGGSEYVTVEGCYLHDFWGAGIMMEGAGDPLIPNTNPISKIWILNNYLDAIRDGTIFVRPSCSHILIQGNTCLNGDSYAIAVLYSTYVTVVDNYAENYNLINVEGGAIQTGAVTYCYIGQNICIAGESQYANDCSGIKIDETEETDNHGLIISTYVIIEGNLVRGYNGAGTSGIFIPSGQHIDVRNNMMIDNYYGFDYYNVTDINFDANSITRSTVAGIRGQYDSSHTGANNVSISRNLIEDGNTALIYLSSIATITGNTFRKGAVNGISMQTTSSGSVIAGNQFVNIPQNAIVVNSGVSGVQVRDNQFWVEGLTGTANTAVTTTNTTLVDTRLSLAPNAWVGDTVTCNGKTLLVTSNTTTTFTGAAWSAGSNPGNGYAWSVGGMGTAIYETSGAGPSAFINNVATGLSGTNFVVSHATTHFVGEVGSAWENYATSIIFTNLPTSNPLVAGQLWSNAGVVTVSAG